MNCFERDFHALRSDIPISFYSNHYQFMLPRYPTKTSFSGLGFSVFARHYLRNHARFLFLRLLRCFTSAGVALLALCIQARVIGHSPDRVTPLGNSRVQAPVCGSPGLIAAYHVLHRHLVPRHSPCAFGSLISQSVKVA